jgi:NADH-quinone oxidoreductase subunit G
VTGPDLVTVTVDGRAVQVPKGTGLVETAAVAGIEIPVFCYEPRLGAPLGACRMCLCEVEGMPKLQAACTLTAQDGMHVHTASTSEKAAGGQNAVLEFILLNHPLDCPDCDKGGECPLQDLTFRWGPASTRMAFAKRTFDKPIPISPLIALDRERCILCYRCTRFSESVSEDGQLVAVNRGASSFIATFEDEPYRAHFSGNVTELCPVGALLPIPYRFRARPWEIQNVPTVCGLCPVGCPIDVTTREGKVARILGRNHPEVNEGWLCDKGRFAFGHLRAEDRIREPLLRRPLVGLAPASLGEAARTAAQALRDAGGSVVVAFSGAETNEIAEAISRLVRQGLGGDCALLPDDPDPALDAYRAPLSAIRSAQVCLVVGDEPVVERAPLVDLWLRAARRNGAEVITVNPAGTVQVPPGAAARVCAALHDRNRGPEELRAVAAALHDAERVALLWSGDDETRGVHLAALAQALDLGEGSGAYFLPRSPNGRGVAAAWHAAGGGRATVAPPAGEIGALVVSGDEAAYDPRVLGLAERARFVLVSAMFMNEAAGWAHAVLPGTSYLERDGTTVNLEGRPQRLRRAVLPPADDELFWLSLLGEELGVEIRRWVDVHVDELAPFAPPGPRVEVAAPAAPGVEAAEGLRLLSYRSAFAGAAVERVPELAFQRPEPEVELAHADARTREIAPGDTVVVSQNGTSVELRARVNRRLLPGVVRIASEHARGLAGAVEVRRA